MTPLRSLWHSDRLYEARQALERHDRMTVDAQVAVSQIPAPSGAEGARAVWLGERFRRLGLTRVRTDEAGNVIGERAGAGDVAPVVICAHMDTVFPHDTELSVRREGERLHGPGIGDNGRGLAAMLAVAAVIDGERLRTVAPIHFVGTTGEEGRGDLRGAKHIFAGEAAGARAAIALDGAGDERIVHRALGSLRYRITYTGAGGHSWTAYGTPNAVHAAAKATVALSRIPVPHAPRTTLSVGRIGGGISVNAIPEEAWLEVDVRSTGNGVLEQLGRQVREAALAACDEENSRRVHGTPPLQVEVALIGDRPSGETPADHPLVVMAIEATRLIGREPELATASTDANVPISQGIPAIAIGAGGRGGDAHTPGEWFDNADGPLGISRALAVVVGAAGVH
jgi:tripeptide aminopeptidase